MVILAFTYVGIRLDAPCGFIRNDAEVYLLDLNGHACDPDIGWPTVCTDTVTLTF